MVRLRQGATASQRHRSIRPDVWTLLFLCVGLYEEGELRGYVQRVTTDGLRPLARELEFLDVCGTFLNRPFLGVSDEGSAGAEIWNAAFESPKVCALLKSDRRTPLIVGIAVDAERLGGIGELAVGPEERLWPLFADLLIIESGSSQRVFLSRRLIPPREEGQWKPGRQHDSSSKTSDH